MASLQGWAAPGTVSPGAASPPVAGGGGARSGSGGMHGIAPAVCPAAVSLTLCFKALWYCKRCLWVLLRLLLLRLLLLRLLLLLLPLCSWPAVQRLLLLRTAVLHLTVRQRWAETRQLSKMHIT
jgi:hypothetical protein